MSMLPIYKKWKKPGNHGNNPGIDHGFCSNSIGIIPDFLVLHAPPCPIPINLVDFLWRIKLVYITNDHKRQSVGNNTNPWNKTIHFILQ